MRKSIELKYGNRRVPLTLPEGATVLTIREPAPTVTPAGFAADLDPALAAGEFRGRRVAVVVADKTRLCGYDRYLPVLLERLAAVGVNADAISLLIAYGTHPRQNDAESRSAYGEVFDRCRFVHHDCTDDTLFRELGRTRRGTPVRIRRDLLAADRRITFGAISHHYFAGFGGGRKLLFPGLGHREAIYRNHALFLDPQTRALAAGCRPGRLDGNPLAEDLAEIEAHCPADLAIHGILDSHGDLCRLLVGQREDDFRRACALHGENCAVAGPDAADLVVASCGGFPKDINFIQAHKAVHNAAAFVRDGGTLIVFAQCRDGIGSQTFLPWFEMGATAAFDRLLADYEGNGGTALAMMEKCRRIRIRLVTDLPEDLVRTIGARRDEPSRALAAIARHPGSLIAIPNASLLVKRQ
jgi:nickel-dependent lactate racemase